MQEKLIFVISPPRSGSTLLQRMLGSHSQVFTHPEPHLITPLAYLGYYDTVDRAPYDHINAAEAMRSFVADLPNREDDYLDALRAYADTLYGRMLGTSSRSRFLDKTPAYALVLPFLTKLYPKAKYVVLTRHPLAVMSSYVFSFFNGSWDEALRFNPILDRYVPAMAKFMRDADVPFIHVQYEQLVAEPESELKRIFQFLDLEHEPNAVEYGAHFQAKKGMGDPISVEKHQRPVTESVHKWAAELQEDKAKRALAEKIIQRLDPADLQAWGYPTEELWAPLQNVGGGQNALAKPKTPWNMYTLQRRILLSLKKDIHRKPFGRVIKKVRYYCDVLLRE